MRSVKGVQRFRLSEGIWCLGFVVMDGSGPDWKGLLKWSIAHSDGTQAPRQLRYGDSLLGVIWLSTCGGLLVCVIISSARPVPHTSRAFSTFRVIQRIRASSSVYFTYTCCNGVLPEAVMLRTWWRKFEITVCLIK